jgi:P27 family predicted phage terminase small subunit
MEGNPGKRAWNPDEPEPPEDLPRCPRHLSPAARAEWGRVADTLHAMGVLTLIDRAALAAYAQCFARWVEAEEQLETTPPMLRTASGRVQPSPWRQIADRQLELMRRFMTELGLSPSARARTAGIVLPATIEPKRRVR